MDTGAFIALQDRSDQFHLAAVSFYKELIADRVPLLTTNFILDETLTWLQRRSGLGYSIAVRFGQWLRDVSSETVLQGGPERGARTRRIVEVSGEDTPFGLLYAGGVIEEEAWRFYGRLGGAGATYTDCVSFASMGMLGLKRAFCFDGHFADAGFARVPEV